MWNQSLYLSATLSDGVVIRIEAIAIESLSNASFTEHRSWVLSVKPQSFPLGVPRFREVVCPGSCSW